MRRIRLPRWLYPGMHLKRWLALTFVGIVVLGLGAAIFIRDLYRATDADTIPIIYWLTGAWLEPQVRAVLVGILGLILIGVGMRGLMRSVDLALRRQQATASWRSFTRSATSPAVRGSWRWAAAPASRPCFVA